MHTDHGKAFFSKPLQMPDSLDSRLRGNDGRERRTGIAGIFCVSIIILFLMRYSKNMMPSGGIPPYGLL
ncbi:hypothetical protein COI11_09110 [Neisseria meningitidis]|nr:hypothetical protein COI11_09110 [Neisseria meningitidis]